MQQKITATGTKKEGRNINERVKDRVDRSANIYQRNHY